MSDRQDLCEKCLVEGTVLEIGTATKKRHFQCPECGHLWREKNLQAVSLGAAGGRAAAASLTDEERTARGEKAANARWQKEKHA